MLLNFEGKACIVTGASRGIGKAIAEALLQRKARVLLVDVLYKEGETSEAELAARFGASNVKFLFVDVSSHNNFETAFTTCRDSFGGIDILVNNAGINGEVNWESQIRTNLMGTIIGCKLALRYMAKNGRDGQSTKKGGVVLNIASVQGIVSFPAMPTYSAGKSGIVAYTRCAGHPTEYDVTGVRLTCLCPHTVNTPMQDYLHIVGMTDQAQQFIENLRIGGDALQAEDVAKAAIKVLSEGATGSVWFSYTPEMEAWEVPDPNTWGNLFACQPKN